MIRTLNIKQGSSFKDRSGLEVKVDRVDANHRVRFSVVSDQFATAGPGEMSYDTFIHRFLMDCQNDYKQKPQQRGPKVR